MDTLGALALGTESPTPELLERKPYKRNASLISTPMRRNILFQSSYQLTLILVLLFKGAEWFGVRQMKQTPNCFKYDDKYTSYNDGPKWDLNTLQQTNDLNLADVSCSSFTILCPNLDYACLARDNHYVTQTNSTVTTQFSFLSLDGFETSCLECRVRDYTHGTIIFNTFIFCQVTIILIQFSFLFFSSFFFVIITLS